MFDNYSSEDDISIESSHTLTNEMSNDLNNPHSQTDYKTTKHSNEALSVEQTSSPLSLSSSPLSATSSAVSCGGGGGSGGTAGGESGVSGVSSNTVNKAYDDSPPSTNSLPATPMPIRKFSKKNKNLTGATEGETSSLRSIRRKKGISPVREEDDSARDSDRESIILRSRRMKKFSVSNIFLLKMLQILYL